MTEQLPTPIEPKDIRVGDTIEREYGHRDYRTREIVRVRHLNPEPGGGWLVEAGDGSVWIDPNADDWVLTDRPEPPRLVGSRWGDPMTGAQYIRTDRDTYQNYLWREGAEHSRGVLSESCRPSDVKIIARLVALDPS